MKSLDALAKTCEPQAAPLSSPQSNEIVTDELVNRIADAVLSKLTAQQSGDNNDQPDADPENNAPDQSNNEGGVTDENEP